jgi:hypothetical protein
MASYSIQQFKKDLFNAMVSRPGKYSGRALGDTSKIALWTDNKVQQLYDGICLAHTLFFTKEMSLIDFGHMIVAECMQESTGNYNLGVRPVDFKDHTSQGIIQVTSGSVVKDFYNWGKPIMDANGKFIMSRNNVMELDLSDPGLCIVVWAWYTKNSVLMKMSMNEYGYRKEWHSVGSIVTPDFGNCMLTWLGGPRHNRQTDRKPFEDYYLRILDYFEAAGFGTKAKFDALLNTKLDNKIIGFYDIIDNKINNRDTCVSPYTI